MRALSSAVGALSGPLHGGAPAYVKPMLEEVTAMGDPEKWVRDTLDAGKRIMGFGHRDLPRRGSALAHSQADGAASSARRRSRSPSGSRKPLSPSSSGGIPSAR